MKKQLLILVTILALGGWGNNAKADWTVVNNGLTSTNVNDLAVNGTTIFAATDGGIFMSANDGATWTLSNSTTDIKALAVKGTDIFAATKNAGQTGVLRSTDNGGTWTAVNTGLLYKLTDAIAVDGANIFTSDYGGKAYISSNDGGSWTEITSLPGFSTIIRNGTSLYAGYAVGNTGYNGIYVSTDNGQTWVQPANTGLTEGVHKMIFMGTTLIATTKAGIFSSVDNGVNWIFHTPVAGVIDNAIALAASGINLFIGTPKGVYMTTDNGISYTDVSGIMGINPSVAFSIKGTTIFSASVYNANGVYKREISEMTGGTTPTAPAAPTNLVATAIRANDSEVQLTWTDNANNEDGFKVQRSTDGTNFTEIKSLGANVTSYSDTGLANTTTYHYRVLAFNATGSSATSNSVNVTTLTGGTGINEEEALTVRMYPNPTSGMFHVQLNATNSTLVIYNIIGEEVYNVSVHANQTLDLNHLPGGIYVVKMENGKNKSMQRLVIQK